MGHTHYITNRWKLSALPTHVVKRIRKLIRRYEESDGDRIVRDFPEEEAKYRDCARALVSPTFIEFNSFDRPCESFYWSTTMKHYGVKTCRFPYDRLVIAVLTVLKRHYKGRLYIGTDATDDDEWNYADDLVEEIGVQPLSVHALNSKWENVNDPSRSRQLWRTLKSRRLALRIKKQGMPQPQRVMAQKAALDAFLQSAHCDDNDQGFV